MCVCAGACGRYYVCLCVCACVCVCTVHTVVHVHDEWRHRPADRAAGFCLHTGLHGRQLQRALHPVEETKHWRGGRHEGTDDGGGGVRHGGTAMGVGVDGMEIYSHGGGVDA